MKKYLFIIFSSLYLISCSSSVRYTSNDENEYKPSKKSLSSHSKNDIDNKTIGSQIVEFSKNWLGVPYKYGGTNEDGIDCSAFVMRVYKPFGYELPRTADQQYDFTHKVSRETLQQGDLIFFKRRDRIFHVGIYVGENQFIHASTSQGVTIQSLEDNWVRNNLFSFGRIE